MQKMILIGASSGIGKSLAIELSRRGHTLGLLARREELLRELQQQLPTKTYIARADAADTIGMRNAIAAMAEEMGGVDCVIYNAGIGESSGKWEKENYMHQVNMIGFAAVANWAFNYFSENKQRGQIVGVSSVAGTRGMRHAIGYSATKAFMWNYMEGQRHKAIAEKLPITITDIRPGFIDTPMTAGQKGMFWVQSAERAAGQIADAIENKRQVVYVTKRWWLMSKLMRAVPDFIWHLT